MLAPEMYPAAGILYESPGQKQSPPGMPDGLFSEAAGAAPGLAQAIALTRAERRETFREAVFLWVTPLVTERMISG